MHLRLMSSMRSALRWGKRHGSLAGEHPADMGAHVITSILDRTRLDPMAVDDVIFGCVDAIGPQSGNIARTAWLSAGLPLDIPGTTVDRQCGSSQQAVHFAAQAVMSGTQDVVLVGGVQNMSSIPISAAMRAGNEYGFDTPFSRSRGWGSTIRRGRNLTVRRRRPDCQEMGYQP